MLLHLSLSFDMGSRWDLGPLSVEKLKVDGWPLRRLDLAEGGTQQREYGVMRGWRAERRGWARGAATVVAPCAVFRYFVDVGAMGAEADSQEGKTWSSHRDRESGWPLVR